MERNLFIERLLASQRGIYCLELAIKNKKPWYILKTH